MNPVVFYNGTVMTGYTVMERCAVLVENGLISDVFSQKRLEQKHFPPDIIKIDVNGAFIAPGFIDTHIHGVGGYGTEDAFGASYNAVNVPVSTGAEAVIEMSRILAQHGVTAFNPTLYPAGADVLLKAVAEISSAIGKEEGARIMGLHLEGPFLSPGKLGVQRPETIMPVNIEYMEKLWVAARGRVVNMTVAPELKGMRELALFCVKMGIILQAGHTDAAYDNMVEGMQAGILHSTHLFNAMSRLDHRNPNAVGAVLIHPEMSCEIIADGLHVHPDLFKLLVRNKPTDKILLVTDSLKPTEQKEEGPFIANGEEVTLKDGLFRRKADDVIAGSSLTMIRGIKNLVDFGFSLDEAVKTASTNPAQVMRYSRQGTIIPGHKADITVFGRNHETEDFEVFAVMVDGRLKKNNL